MTSLLIIQLIGFLVLLGLSALFSSSETALFSLDPHEVHRIEEDCPATALRLQSLLAEPTRLLSTILIGNTIANVEMWMLGAVLLRRVGVEHPLVQVAVLTLITLVFGEFGPKRLAIRFDERLARFYARPLCFLVTALKPLRLLLESMTQSFAHIFQPSGHILTQEEYDTLVDAGGESGSLDEHEHTMVRAILALETLYVGDVMTPRVDVIGVDLTDSTVNLQQVAISSRVRYLILYREQLDDIVGVLSVRKYLLDPSRNLQRASQPPWFVPEQSTLDHLLPQMRVRQDRIAIVVDEYGGTSGLISRGDILEELTGQMDPEEGHDAFYQQLTHRAWMIEGRMSLVDVNRLTGLSLHAETADRLSGWCIEQLERLPSVGELVQGDGFRARIHETRRNRILMVVIETDPDQEDGT